MQSIKEVLDKNTISAFRLPKVIDVYQCPQCGSNVEVLRTKVRGHEKIIDRCLQCENQQMARQVEENHERIMVRKMQAIFDEESLINDDLKGTCFENYYPKTESQHIAKHESMQYVKEFAPKQSKNLLLSGTYGVGKSHLAHAITKSLVEKGYSCIFITVPRLFTKIKSTWSHKTKLTEEDVMKALIRVDVLVLDDIGAEHIQLGIDGKGQGWGVSKIFEIVDSRNGKHTIYTTNLTSGEMQIRFGQRNFSRLMQNTKPVVVEGPDNRLRKFEEGV